MNFQVNSRFSLLLFILLFLCVISVFSLFSGETIQIKSGPTPMTAGNYRLFHPAWSPDGEFLAMTGDNYQGIWIMDFQGIIFQQLSQEERIGYRFSWSNDSREIACRLIKSTPHQRLKAIKVFDIQTGQNRLVTDFRPGVGFPAWIESDQKICFLDNEKLRIVDTERNFKSLPKKATQVDDTLLFEINGRLSLYTSRKGLQPIDINTDSRCLNAYMSPDNQKITFEMTNGKIYTMNLDGTHLMDLGPGSHPRWAPDSENIVYFIAKDDGESVIESDLFVTDSQGTQKFQLTQTDDRIEMHPHWSPVGDKIIFDEYETGIIYLIELERVSLP